MCPFLTLFSFVMDFSLSNTVLSDFFQYPCAIVSFLLPLQSWCIIFIEGRRSSERSSRSFALIWNLETELQTQCAASIRLESGSPALWSQHGDCQSFEQFGLGSSHKMHKGHFILQYLLYSISIFSISQPSLKEKALNLKKKKEAPEYTNLYCLSNERI